MKFNFFSILGEFEKKSAKALPLQPIAAHSYMAIFVGGGG